MKWRHPAREGKTVILVTHDIGEAVSMASRVIVMEPPPRPPPASSPSTALNIRVSGQNGPRPFEARKCPESNGYFQTIWDELDVHSIH